MARLPLTLWLAIGAALVGAQVFALWLMGQPAWCECGYVKVWEGVVLSSGNSQHISDWYTISHLIHGFLFYWVLTLLAPRLPWAARLAIALGVEVAWEVAENTPWLIEHYRQQALAQGYVGDSILNSFTDTLAMVAGFILALRLPVWASVALAVGLEGLSLYFIRDGLILNIMNFVYPMEGVQRWQIGS